MKYDFPERLTFSRGIKEKTDIETIKKMIPGCVNVIKTEEKEDRSGIDYIATLNDNATINIDAKTREKGAIKYWKKNIPELAIETWSVKPGGKNPPKIGWTFNQSTQVDMILFTFEDTDIVYLLSFQHLRIAAEKKIQDWKTHYKIGGQNSGDWESECIFIPISEIFTTIREISQGHQQTLGASY